MVLAFSPHLGEAMAQLTTNASVSSSLALAHEMARHPADMEDAARESLQGLLGDLHHQVLHDDSDARSIGIRVASFMDEYLSQDQWSSLHAHLDKKTRRSHDELSFAALKARALVTKRGVGYQAHITQYKFDGPLIRHYSGVPPWIKLAVVDGDPLPGDPADTMLLGARTIFRHYTPTAEILRAIVASDQLIPGPLAFKDYFSGSGSDDAGHRMLVGAFMTRPHYRHHEVGVEQGTHYIDFLLHPGTVLLRTSSDSNKPHEDWCFMVPGVPKRRDWVNEVYRDWVTAARPDKETMYARGRAADADDRARRLCRNANLWETFREIDAAGGAEAFSRIPIIAVSSGSVD